MNKTNKTQTFECTGYLVQYVAKLCARHNTGTIEDAMCIGYGIGRMQYGDAVTICGTKNGSLGKYSFLDNFDHSSCAFVLQVIKLRNGSYQVTSCK